MLNCENCCYCGYGKEERYIKCPFYQARYETLDIRQIEKATNKEQEAGLYWATCLLYGHRVTKNERKAITILKKLSGKGYIPASYVLSLCYFEGIHVSRKPEVAFDLCKEAARNGCNLAEIQLYYCYRDGLGVKEDLKKAGCWCRSAACHKSSEMYYEYAQMCCTSKYGQHDLKTACEFYERALECGNKDAFNHLVELHKNHLEECYPGYMITDCGLGYISYLQRGDFCLENKYAPNIEKALENYRLAGGELMKEMERHSEDGRCVGLEKKHGDYFSLLGRDVSDKEKMISERIEKSYSLFFTQYADQEKKTFYDMAMDGDANSQYRLGCLLEDRNFLLCDRSESVKWFRRSAEQGNAAAQSRLGNCYYNGEGVLRDYAEAMKWFGLAAEQEEASAQYQIGRMYGTGTGVGVNYDEAFKWYRRSAQQGYAAGQNGLGWCYGTGNGVELDYNEALKWYCLAAEQGHATAQSNLGYYYSYGIGVEQDFTEAVKWYRLAAEQGNAIGQYNLAYCYYNGHGVSQNYAEAKKWCCLASAQGNKDADVLLKHCEAASMKNTSVEYRERNYGSDNTHVSFEQETTFGRSQVLDHGSFLEKQLSGTLTPQERDEYDRRWV